MSKLHEILAVEGDLEGVYKKILEETKGTFQKKTDRFFGYEKRLEMFNEELKDEEKTERRELTTTVGDKLEYTEDSIIRYLDVVLQKESTNQNAWEDLIIDGITISTNVPATFLLGLENKLKFIRQVYEVIPTLTPGIAWDEDATAGKGVYKMSHPEEKFKTAKTFMHKILYQATDKHPAQIEKWEEQKPVGKYINNVWCGLISPAKKSILLSRIDKLIQATKKARQRANMQEVVERTIGKEIFDYINGSAS